MAGGKQGVVDMISTPAVRHDRGEKKNIWDNCVGILGVNSLTH